MLVAHFNMLSAYLALFHTAIVYHKQTLSVIPLYPTFIYIDNNYKHNSCDSS